MEDNPEFAKSQIFEFGPQGTDTTDVIAIELAGNLNALGPYKDINQWRGVRTQSKSYTVIFLN